MPEKIPLPCDNWVVLRDPDAITEREAEDQLASILEHSARLTAKSKRLGKEASRLASDRAREWVAWCIESWSFPFAPSAETLRDIPRVVFTAIDEETKAVLQVLIPNVPDGDDGEDED